VGAVEGVGGCSGVYRWSGWQTKQPATNVTREAPLISITSENEIKRVSPEKKVGAVGGGGVAAVCTGGVGGKQSNRHPMLPGGLCAVGLGSPDTAPMYTDAVYKN
jgi:hypothetical protein